jgi:anti-anti-sigma regulatory factor
MPVNAVWLKIDGQCAVGALQEALKKLNGAGGELVLDFSSVHRIDPSALRVLENLASTVDGKAKIALQGVNIDVYRVLKLMKLAARFSFLT